MSFDPIELLDIDVVERMFSRLLLQFQNASVLKNILGEFATEIQTLLDETNGVFDGRSPLLAVGSQLEGLGRIVGQKRIVFDYSLIGYFTPDTAGFTFDSAPVWVENAPTSDPLLADDAIYRQLIESKIFRNFVKYASVSENNTVSKLAFDTPVGFILTGPMSVKLVVPATISTVVFNFLTLFTTTKLADRTSIMPYPPTLQIDSVLFVPSLPFIPDTENTPDVAKFAV